MGEVEYCRSVMKWVRHDMSKGREGLGSIINKYRNYHKLRTLNLI